MITLLAGLASCEMKDEITGKDGIAGDKGSLTLNIAAKTATGSMTTKADDDVKVNVDEFPVTITGKDVEYTKEFASLSALQAESPLELPVGTYTIAAHSPGEYASQMSSAYYAGEKEIKIMKDVSTDETITCKIQNVKITVAYTADFIQAYDSWNITVTDKKGHVAAYTKDDGTDLAGIYWKLDDSTDKIYINGSAITKAGETITVDGVAVKSQLPGHEDTDGTYYKGGDQLVIKLNPTKVESSTPGVEKNSISITVTGFNSEKNEDIEIDVDENTGGGETPDPDPDPTPTPGDDAIVISEPNGTSYLTDGVVVDGGNFPTDVAIQMDVKNGLQNMFVKIETNNSDFKDAAGLMAGGALLSGDGMDLASEEATELEALFSLPTPGDETYTFSMNSDLFEMLNIFGGTHSFILKIVDQANPANTKTATLKVTIIKEEENS